jgi:hypothetical protein
MAFGIIADASLFSLSSYASDLCLLRCSLFICLTVVVVHVFNRCSCLCVIVVVLMCVIVDFVGWEHVS